MQIAILVGAIVAAGSNDGSGRGVTDALGRGQAGRGVKGLMAK